MRSGPMSHATIESQSYIPAMSPLSQSCQCPTSSHTRQDVNDISPPALCKSISVVHQVHVQDLSPNAFHIVKHLVKALYIQVYIASSYTSLSDGGSLYCLYILVAIFPKAHLAVLLFENHVFFPGVIFTANPLRHTV